MINTAFENAAYMKIQKDEKDRNDRFEKIKKRIAEEDK